MLKAMTSVGSTLPPYNRVDRLPPLNIYEDMCRLITHLVISTRGRCVVVAIARNCGSTSNVFCRKIDNSGSGEGDSFQLLKSENRSFWTNEEVTNEGLKFGCLLEYRVVTRHQSLLGRCAELGEQDGKQFIFHRNAGTEPQNVNKILLDLQDDESVHGGLKEALEYYNRKDADRILLDIINLILDDCERLVEAHKLFNRKDAHTIQLDLRNLRFVYFERLNEALKCLNRKDADRILLDIIHLILVDCECLMEALKRNEGTKVLDFINLTFVRFECLVEAIKCFNPKDVHTIQLDLRNLRFFYFERLNEVLKCFNIKVVDELRMQLINLIFVHCHNLWEAFKRFNPKFPGLQAYSDGTRISFIGIKAGMINNERVTLETMSGEWLDMPLNCRESLVLSTGPVHLQLKRPWDVADDDVGGVAVVKYEAGEATCDGLILRYKPYIISRDEEPVEMQNAFGEVISVRGLGKVLFDTGNEVGTGISRELLLKMNLQPDPKKKKKVELIGEESREFETVQIELVVRGHHFSVCGLVDAVAKDTYLLVGMDVIQQLYDKGYTIGY